MVSFLSALTVVFSIAAKGGSLDQIRINWLYQSVKGFSWRREVINWLSYCVWVAHGYAIGSHVEIYAQSLGVVTSGILLTQCLAYRKGRNG